MNFLPCAQVIRPGEKKSKSQHDLDLDLDPTVPNIGLAQAFFIH